jgi:hypothetical protein
MTDVGSIAASGDIVISKNDGQLKIQRSDDPTNYYYSVVLGAFGSELNMYGGYGGQNFLRVASVGTSSNEIGNLFLQPGGKPTHIGGQLNLSGPMYFNGVVNTSWGYTIENRTKFGLYFQTAHSGYPGILFSDNGNVSIGYDQDTSYRLYISGALGVSGNATIDGNISATGQVTGGVASDARLKKNIIDLSITKAKTIVLGSRPVEFEWNDKATKLFDRLSGKDIGLVAQEVESNMPNAVSPIWGEYKRVEYDKFTAPLIKVAQDHENRILRLENELRRLNEENTRLRTKLQTML